MVRGVGFCGPLDKVHERLTVGHVDFAQVLHHLRMDLIEVVILRDIVSPRGSPIAIALEAGTEAIHLRDDVDVLARADAFGFVQVEIDILLEHLIIGVLIEHDRPGLTAARGRNGRSVIGSGQPLFDGLNVRVVNGGNLIGGRARINQSCRR